MADEKRGEYWEHPDLRQRKIIITETPSSPVTDSLSAYTSPEENIKEILSAINCINRKISTLLEKVSKIERGIVHDDLK